MKFVGGSDMTEGLILEEHESPPAEFPETQFLTHMIGIGCAPVHCPMSWKESGLEKTGVLVPGSVFLSTAALQSGIRWGGQLRMMVLSIGIEMMERALPEPFTKRPVDLITLRAGERDPVLEHLIGALSSAFERQEPSGRLVLENLGNATAIYLAQRYGSSPLHLPIYTSGLGRERLSRVIDYIDTYLANDLSVGELSGVACLSPYHFGKMFKRAMEQSVHQYVTARRIDRSKSLLSSRALSLSEIALSVGFQDQSQFTTIFKRHTGVTPGAYTRVVRA
jgi:AraC family transcriptional regulator